MSTVDPIAYSLDGKKQITKLYEAFNELSDVLLHRMLMQDNDYTVDKAKEYLKTLYNYLRGSKRPTNKRGAVIYVKPIHNLRTKKGWNNISQEYKILASLCFIILIIREALRNYNGHSRDRRKIIETIFYQISNIDAAFKKILQPENNKYVIIDEYEVPAMSIKSMKFLLSANSFNYQQGAIKYTKLIPRIIFFKRQKYYA